MILFMIKFEVYVNIGCKDTKNGQENMILSCPFYIQIYNKRLSCYKHSHHARRCRDLPPLLACQHVHLRSYLLP